MSAFGRKQEGKGETVQRLTESFVMLAPIAVTWGVGMTVAVTTILVYPAMTGPYRTTALIGMWVLLSPGMSAFAFLIMVKLVKSLLSVVENVDKRERGANGRYVKINKNGKERPEYLVVVDKNKGNDR